MAPARIVVRAIEVMIWSSLSLMKMSTMRMSAKTGMAMKMISLRGSGAVGIRPKAKPLFLRCVSEKKGVNSGILCSGVR